MVTIIQSDVEVPAGSYGAFLEASSLPYRLVRLHAGDTLPQAGELSHLIILGGAMGVHDGERFPFLLDLQRLMSEVVSQQIPLLGICLGGQLLAHILGGRVTANCYGEKGSQEVELTPAGVADPLFAGIPQTFTTFQWHNDSFEPPP
ncbi:MAG TPA: type 1 glutamine amidotransferase, partial [Geobacterales bacterium]|nr:type 1 glutamine amidotransferase [Geobacterales bacterium]